MDKVLPQFKETEDSNRWTFLESLLAPPWGSSRLSLGSTPLHPLHNSSKFNITQYLYADDIQIYLELDSRNFNSNITELANCFEAIQVCLENNKLILNPVKTEFTLIIDDGTRNLLKSLVPVNLFGNTMEATESMTNLGVFLDADNSMQRHVANLCCACYYHLREL